MTLADDLTLEQQAAERLAERQRHIEQARAEVLSPFRRWTDGWTGARGGYVVLDTETTDLDGEIIELAVVDLNGQVLFDERIRPVGKVSPGAFEVHGISTGDLAKCPDFGHFWPRIRRLLCSSTVLVYNKTFDFRAIYNSLRAVQPDWHKGPANSTDPYSADYWAYTMASRHAECVMEAYAPIAGMWSPWHGSYRWAKLADACTERGVDTSDLKAHAALGDAQATARLIQACAKLTPADLPDIVGRENEGEEE